MAIVAPRRRVGSVTLRNTLTGLAFCAPWIIGLLAFRAYPIAAAFYYSLTDYQGMNPPEFIGLAKISSMNSPHACLKFVHVPTSPFADHCFLK